MRLICTALLALGLAAAPALAKPSADRGTLSWGKLDISFEQYRTDAIECTAAGTLAILDERPNQHEIPPPTNTGNGFEPADIHTFIASQRLLAFQAGMEARRERQAIVDQCLSERGYRRFLLTREQRALLRSFEHGSEERRRYLYSLATDPDVLARQAYAG